MTPHLRVWPLFALLFSLTACVSPTGNPSMDDPGLDGKGDADALAFASCWMEVEDAAFGENHRFVCEVADQVQGLRIEYVDIEFNGSRGQQPGGFSGSVGSFGGTNPGSNYPLEVAISVPRLDAPLILPQGFSIRERVRNERTFTRESPLVVELPYQVWQVEVKSEYPEEFIASIAPMATTLDLGDFEDGSGSSRADYQAQAIFVTGGSSRRAAVVAPENADEVRAALTFPTVDGLGESEVRFTGRGTYVLLAESLRKTSDTIDEGTDPVDPTDPTDPNPVDPPPVDENCVSDDLAWAAEVRDAGSRASSINEVLDAHPCTPNGSVEGWNAWFTTVEHFIDAFGSAVSPDEGAVLTRFSTEMAPQEINDDDAFLTLHSGLLAVLADSGSQLDASEQAGLDALIAGAPNASSDNGYVAWVRGFVAQLDGSGSQIDTHEMNFLNAHVAIRPEAFGALAFAEWFPAFEAQLNDSGRQLDDHERNFLSLLVSSKADRADSSGYVDWLGLLVAKVEGSGSSADTNEEEFLNQILSVQPCIQGDPAEADAAHADVSVDSDFGVFIDRAIPTTC